MRRTQTNLSTKHKQYRRNSLYLNTATEPNINSPTQSWLATTANNRRTKDRSHTSYKGVQQFNQQFVQEINSLFISEEQGMLIRQILELDRKGKINANNSFQLPIKVIDPKSTERINVEFWRFASELLGSSICIYDKRVDYLYLSSNKIMGELVRIKDKDGHTQQQIVKSQANQRTVQNLQDFDVFTSRLKININGIQSVNNESPARLNLNQTKGDFLRNDIHLINLRGIGSNNSSELMLNSFQMGSDLRIELYRKQHFLEAEETKDETDFIKQNGQNSEYFWQFSQISIFTQIARYRDKHLGNNLQQQDIKSIFQSMYNYFPQSQKSQSFITINSQENAQTRCGNHNFDQIEMNSHTSQSKQSYFSYQQKGLFQKSLKMRLEDITTIAEPWKIQFKQKKLRKKLKGGNLAKRLKKIIDESDQDIDFLIDTPLVRNNIFNGKGINSLRISCLKQYQDRHLLPKTITPHIQIQKQRRSRKAGEQKHIKNQNNKNIQLKQQTKADYESPFLKALSMDSTQKNTVSEIQSQHHDEAKFQQEQMTQSGQITRSQYNLGIKNIRQIKQLIFMHLTRQASLRISQIQLGLTPAEILIIFLHLANQKNLQIHSIDSQCDVELIVAQ